MSKQTKEPEQGNVAAVSEAEQTESKQTKVKVRPGEELVEYTAPLLPGMGTQDVIVGVNGEIIRIKRGEPVQIKRKFVNALNNAAKQQVAAYKAAAEAQQTKKLYDM